MTQLRIVWACAISGTAVLAAGCAPSVSCPSATRKKTVKRHSGEHLRTAHFCLKKAAHREVRHGPYLFQYHVAGRLKLTKEGHYRDGLRHGRWVLRKKDEVLVSHFKQDFRHGLHKRTVGGDVVERGRYANTLREGAWLIVKSKGKRVIREQVTFRKGKRHGAASYTDSHGHLLRRGHWVKGVRHGRWTYFGPGNRLQWDEPWVKGVKHGLVRYYDASGRLMRRTCNYIQGTREPCKDLARPEPPRP